MVGAWWLDSSVAQAIGNNTQEKWNCFIAKFRIYKYKNQVNRPLGCSKESFNIIYKNYKEGVRKEKSELCRRKQLERCKAGEVYSHRYERGGVQSIIDRFVRPSESLLMVFFFKYLLSLIFCFCWTKSLSFGSIIYLFIY